MCYEFDVKCWTLKTIKNKGARLPISVDLRREWTDGEGKLQVPAT